MDRVSRIESSALRATRKLARREQGPLLEALAKATKGRSGELSAASKQVVENASAAKKALSTHEHRYLEFAVSAILSGELQLDQLRRPRDFLRVIDWVSKSLYSSRASPHE